MLLVRRPRFKRVNASGGEGPGRFADSLRDFFGFAATVFNGHHPIQAINSLLDNAFLVRRRVACSCLLMSDNATRTMILVQTCTSCLAGSSRRDAYGTPLLSFPFPSSP